MRERLRRMRKAKNLSPQQASNLAGISVSMWLMVETGQRTPSLPVALRMAAVVGGTLDCLFGASTDSDSHPPRVRFPLEKSSG